MILKHKSFILEKKRLTFFDIAKLSRTVTTDLKNFSLFGIFRLWVCNYSLS